MNSLEENPQPSSRTGELDETPVASEPSLRQWLVVASFFVITFVAYWPVVSGGFVWDDLVLVKRNPLITREHSLATIWFRGDFALSTVALWLQRLAWGDQATGYHVVNIFLHALGAVLLWRVLKRLGACGAWLAAALFAVHPVCVASAAWISELKNTLSLVFVLASTWCYLRSCSEDVQRRGIWYGLALGAFLLALLSKTSVVMMPVVLLLIAALRDIAAAKRELIRLVPFFALSLGFGLMTIWFQRHQVIAGVDIDNGTLPERAAGAGMALWFYLGKALAPVNLCMIYPKWNLSAGPLLFLPGVLWLALLGVCWKFRAGFCCNIFVALASFAVLLFPVLGFFDMYFLSLSRVSDHLQYLPLVCVTSLVAAALYRFLPAKWVAPAAAVLLIACCALTFQRAKVFRTDEALWADVLAKNPMEWNAHNNLGCIRAEQGRMQEALEHFEASLKVRPTNTKALVNVARIYLVRGDFPGAEAKFLEALKIRSDDVDAHEAYGTALMNAGRLSDALPHLREAVRLKPSEDGRLQLAGLCHSLGLLAEAVEHLRQVVEASPGNLDAVGNLAWLLATASDEKVRAGAEAVRLAERACRLTQYREARFVGTLAAAQAETGQFKAAVQSAQKAVALAQAAGNMQFAAMNQQLLQLYQSGGAYHEPPPAAK